MRMFCGVSAIIDKSNYDTACLGVRALRWVLVPNVVGDNHETKLVPCINEYDYLAFEQNT